MTTSQGDPVKFNARSYLQARFAGPEDFRSEFYLKSFHDFYQKYHTEWDATKARVLEFGGGPCIHTLISGAPFVSEVVFSEYAEDNLQEVKLWRDNDPTCFGWGPFFDYVVKKLEGQTDPTAPAEREKQLRSRITSIIPCNIWKDDILGVPLAPFDIVSCSLTIVTTSKNLSEYKANLGKLSSCLKPGGFYIGVEALGVTWWSAGEIKYPTVTFTTDELHDTIRSAGFDVLGYSTVDIPEASRFKSSDTKSYIFTAARKKN